MSSPFREIVVILIILRVVYWVWTAGKAKPTKRSESTASRLLHNMLLYAGYILAWPIQAPNSLITTGFEPQSEVLESLGAVLVTLGVGLAIWARTVLGVYWSGKVTIKEGHRLIRSGPYRFVRNPIYFGDVVTVLGMVLALGEVRGSSGLAFIVAYALLKGRREERLLREEFGDEFDAYRREVKFLIPFVF